MQTDFIQIATRQHSGQEPPARTHYAAEVAVLPLALDWVNALQGFAYRVRNEKLADALPIEEAVAADLYRLLDSQTNLMRLGPVISIYDLALVATNLFRLDNFFGVEGDMRHIGPNKVFINTSAEAVYYDVINEPGETCFEIIRRNYDAAMLMQFLAPFHEIDLSALVSQLPVRRLVIAPNHALVPPTETLFHRAQSAGQMLVLHGYFRAA